MVEWKADGKCVIRVMSDGTIFTGKMADAYTKGNERERELLIIGWNEAMAQAEAEIEKLRAAVTEERERCAWIADKFEGWSGSFVARAIRDADFEERWEGYGWR